MFSQNKMNMEMSEIKEQVLQLINEKEKIEAEIKDFREILACNNVGMDEPLIDSEDYPRVDIDVYRIRKARSNIICLQNDHISLMKLIEDGLHYVHSIIKGETNQPVPSETCVDETIVTDPFLRVNLVFPNSPAECAGIQVEDLILEFGFISSRNFQSVRDISNLVENSRYKPIPVKIKRKMEIIHLYVVPHPWNGKGLVGCNLVLLKADE